MNITNFGHLKRMNFVRDNRAFRSNSELELRNTKDPLIIVTDKTGTILTPIERITHRAAGNKVVKKIHISKFLGLEKSSFDYNALRDLLSKKTNLSFFANIRNHFFKINIYTVSVNQDNFFLFFSLYNYDHIFDKLSGSLDRQSDISNLIFPALIYNNQTGQILEVNSRFSNLAGLSLKEIIARPLHEVCNIYSPIDLEANEMFDQIYLKSYYPGELSFVEGKIYDVDYFQKKVGANNTLVVLLKFKETAQLGYQPFDHFHESNFPELVNKTKDEHTDKFLKMMIHDLRGKFSNMINVSNLMLDMYNKIDENEYHELVVMLNQTVKSNYRLYENFTKLINASSGRLKPEIKPVTLNEIFKTAGDNLAHAIKRKDVKLIADIQDDQRFEGDVSMLGYIVQNILDNAIKYTYRGSEVKVTAGREEDKVFIKVIDQGPGMPYEKLQKVFNIYERDPQPGTEGESGSGLSLHVIKKMLELIDGQIAVRNNEPQGFCVELFFKI